jgi:hypothetical protein
MSGSAWVLVILPVVIKAGGPFETGGVGKPAVSSAMREGEGWNFAWRVSQHGENEEKSTNNEPAESGADSSSS